MSGLCNHRINMGRKCRVSHPLLQHIMGLAAELVVWLIPFQIWGLKIFVAVVSIYSEVNPDRVPFKGGELTKPFSF